MPTKVLGILSLVLSISTLGWCWAPSSVKLAPIRSTALQVTPSVRSQIDSFKVMEILAKANELEAKGEHICHMEIGQPGSGAPTKVLDAARAALDHDRLGYTGATGIPQLRNAISKHYKDKYQLEIDPARVVVCTGSSASFLLAFLGCFEHGDHVALCSSGYPCYRNLMSATGLNYVSIPVNERFKVTGPMLEATVANRKRQGLPPLKGIIMSSPGNPTGVMLSPGELEELCRVCDRHGITFLSDEIYHGLTYGTQVQASALAFSHDAVAINSFSKYYSMTGWRLGWMVVPPSLIGTMTRLTENMYISAPTLSQLGACAAFDCDDELQLHIQKYADNRKIVLETLEGLGLLGGAAPSDGAFYVYVDLRAHGVEDSAQLCDRLLREAKVALTPGIDFEDPAMGMGKHRLRFSYSRDTTEVMEGMARFQAWWLQNMKPVV